MVFAKICKINFPQIFQDGLSTKLNSREVLQNWVAAKLKFKIMIIVFFSVFFPSNNYINWYSADRNDRFFFFWTIFTSLCSSLILEKTSFIFLAFTGIFLTYFGFFSTGWDSKSLMFSFGSKKEPRISSFSGSMYNCSTGCLYFYINNRIIHVPGIFVVTLYEISMLPWTIGYHL